MIDESSLLESSKGPKAKAKAKAKSKRKAIEDDNPSPPKKNKAEHNNGMKLEDLIDELCKDVSKLQNAFTVAKNSADDIEIEVTHSDSLAELKDSKKLEELATLKADSDSMFNTPLRRAMRLSTNWQGIKKLCGETVDEKNKFRTALDAVLKDGCPKVVAFQKAVTNLKKRVQFELQLAAQEKA